MNKLYSFLLLAWLSVGLVASTHAQVIEDFEGGSSDLTWNAADGSFMGPVANPNTMNSVNTSANVGQYTKDSTRAFSLLIADLAAPIMLTSANNQLFIDVYAGDDTRFIVKLEGTGPAIEAQSVIPVRNQWRRYQFDLSSAAPTTTFTKIILFFDFGNEPGKGTYYFDNIRLGAAGACAGVARDLAIVDDFGCQRAAIRAGLDSLTVVENPDPDAVNGPGPVGRWSDPEGGFSALVYRFNGPINLVDRPILKLKYYSPIANRLLIKLEGGTSPGREIGVDVTATNEWQEYTFDFSAFADGNFRDLTIFTNAGQNAPGVVYYFDDIRFEAKQVDFLEDFEGPLTLFFQTQNGGTFSVIPNPDRTGLNTTETTGSFVKGAQPLSSVVALSATPLDFSSTSQINMLVWAPAGSSTVRLSAISATAGRKDVTRDITATEQWVEVGFAFPDLADARDVTRLEILFDAALPGPRTYYFDQISLSAASIDPCEGTVANLRIIDDFECQRNVAVVNGLTDIMIVNNPDFTGNPSAKVGKYTDPQGPFSNISYEFPNGIDGDVFNNLSIDIWSPRIVPIGFKLEDSANGTPNVEVIVDAKSAMMWENYRVAFPTAAGGQFRRLVIFLNFNAEPQAGDVYYVDNVRFARGPVNACVSNFETPNTSITEWNGFGGNGAPENFFDVVENPDKSGINPSDSVGQFTEIAGGAPFAGIFTNFGAPVVFPDPANKTIRLKIWAMDTFRVVVKLERGAGNTQTGDVFTNTPYTTPGAWQELTVDYFNFDTEGAQFTQLTLIPAFGVVPDMTRQIYFDDIVIGASSCPIGTAAPEVRAIAGMRAFPNPTREQLFVEVPAATQAVQFVDALGRMVSQQSATVAADGGLQELSVGDLPTGFYTVVAISREGTPLGRVRVAVAE